MGAVHGKRPRRYHSPSKRRMHGANRATRTAPQCLGSGLLEVAYLGVVADAAFVSPRFERFPILGEGNFVVAILKNLAVALPKFGHEHRFKLDEGVHAKKKRENVALLITPLRKICSVERQRDPCVSISTRSAVNFGYNVSLFVRRPRPAYGWPSYQRNFGSTDGQQFLR